MKHLTVRFAWHDNRWNGKICKVPKSNVYCIGNYSLLSPRIQRRINLDIECSYKNEPISKVIKEKQYVPPCYWCINALGNEKCEIEDPHPFQDTLSWGEKFNKRVPPLKVSLDEYSVFTWCFKLGFAQEGYKRYVSDKEVKKRTKRYLEELEPSKSIVFFYLNYSNPVNGDNYKYLLLGAGLVKRVSKPKEYDIPDDLLNEIQSIPSMENFHKQAWQFKIELEPNSVFILPYHDYLKWIEKESRVDSEEKWRKLSEIAISVEDETLVPHFKYVSMHISHDKAIYLLYLIKRSLKRIKEHGIVEYEKIKNIEEKVEYLLELAWRERGKYPGFKNALYIFLKHQYPKEYLRILLPEIEKWCKSTFSSIDEFFKKLDDNITIPSELETAMRIIKRNKELIEFLSLFDLTQKQMERIMETIEDKLGGLETVKRNPYLLLEYYHYEFIDSWDLEETDYGLALYQIDIGLIPDPRYTNWDALYDAQSPERIRALIVDLLKKVALRDGHSCLTRKEILNYLRDYPLYYIDEEFRVDLATLSRYEEQQIFKEKFVIKIIGNDVIYQLKELRKMEEIIESFVNKMLKKKYQMDDEEIKQIVEDEKRIFGEELYEDEREKLYYNALSNGLFILTGKAGSGKTTAVVNLIRWFKEHHKLPIYVFTPTGKANLVIRERLSDSGVNVDDKNIRVSTIHRFLYGGLYDFIESVLGRHRREEIFRLIDLVSLILSGKWEFFDEFGTLAKRWRFTPKVIIIDESSMVDEVLLATLLCLINPDTLEHLILVGDEKQLPPIGVGRPLVDVIFHLKRKDLEKNIIRLKSNLRFDPSKKLGILSELFESDELLIPTQLGEILENSDDSLEIRYFSNIDVLKGEIRDILVQILKEESNEPIVNIQSIFNLFAEIFEVGNELNLDKVQILSPRRVGNYGTLAINRNVVLDGVIEFKPRTKLICEENKYLTIKERDRKILGIANGSIGYIRQEGSKIYVEFDEFQELRQKYGWNDIRFFIYKIKDEIYSPLKTDRSIDLGYAITIHKAQGSDFDYVILVFPEISPFITKELIYTGITRPRKKLYLLIHTDLKEDFPNILARLHENSEIEHRKTLLFEYKRTPFKPYKLERRNGETIELKSKIEYIIAKTLDELGIEFEYEPKDFIRHSVLPDFKIYVNGEAYYMEYLGLMDNPRYRERWFKKLKIYEELKVDDKLVTLTEAETGSNIKENLKNIIEDIKHRRLKTTEGDYSKHHYEI